MATNKLCYLIADNFAVYYKAHSYHLNIVGSDFAQYHGLFQEVYDKLWEWHDGLAEQLRISGELFPYSLKTIGSETSVPDSISASSASDMLKALDEGLSYLNKEAGKIYGVAEPALETVLGDYCADITKLQWKIRATRGIK